MLQNAYFLAKIGADTAENEQHFAEILPTNAAAAIRIHGGSTARSAQGKRRCCGWTTQKEATEAGRRLDRANFRGFVLGCVEAKFCKKICV